MINKVLLGIFMVAALGGCNTVNSSTLQMDDWQITKNTELEDLGVNILNLANPQAQADLALSSKNQQLNAVNVFVEQGENVGIQYQAQKAGHIEYIKIRDGQNLDQPFIKIYRNEQGKWVFAQFESSSEKQPKKYQIIDFD